MPRRTFRLELEVTVEDADMAPAPDYGADALADDIRDEVFRAAADALPYDVVAMTVSPKTEVRTRD